RVNRGDRRVAIQLRASVDMPEVGSLQKKSRKKPSEIQNEFQDYFALAPPASPDSSDDSILPADD
ncbi:hypothetical protein PIB30_085147, partial [Stylosanthes scabra]|nr:hypothetical protein [Stylosanthes scabra]